jgi:hypothetical protein
MLQYGERARMMKGLGTVVGAVTAMMFFNHFTYGIAIQVCIVLAAVALVVSIKANANRPQQQGEVDGEVEGSSGH